jgi:uncharacterized membrane protein YGL010W
MIKIYWLYLYLSTGVAYSSLLHRMVKYKALCLSAPDHEPWFYVLMALCWPAMAAVEVVLTLFGS